MANTTNLNLKKPLGTEQALIADINGNMDKIDAYAGTTNAKLDYKNLGAFTTESGLASALDTEIASMSNYTQRAIRFNFTSADGAFGAYYYLGILSRGSAANYCAFFVETFSNKSNPHSIDGSKNGTWGFSNLNSKISISHFNQYYGASKTITQSLETRTAYMLTVSTIASNNITNIYTAIVVAPPSSSNTGKIEWLTGTPSSGITVTLSGITLTIESNSTTWINASLTKL